MVAGMVAVSVLVLAGVVVSSGGVGAQDPGSSAAVSGAEANEGGPGFVAAQTRVALGGSYSCALLDDGTVRCWGNNGTGQLGSTTLYGGPHVIPNPVPQPAVNLGGHAALAITTGDAHSCALLNDGTVRCWGYNYWGQLGSTTTGSTPDPQPAVNLGGHAAVAITAGGFHACALLNDGTVRCWGYNYHGQLGSATNNGTDNPNPVPQPAVNLGGHAAVAVTAGDVHSCALLDDGTVRCWGNNYDGQLGSTTNNGTLDPNPVPQPAVNLGGHAAVAVTAGDVHSCALLDDGAVRCWGYNRSGQLGSTTNNGTLDPNPAPQPAVNLGGHAAVAVTAGGEHSCALLDDGAVRCWGRNGTGQLGSTTNNGTLDPNPAPQPAVNLGGHSAVAITTGGEHSCALLDDGTVRCWGNNNAGQLGSTTNNGTSNANPTPQPAVVGLALQSRIFVSNVIASGPAQYDFLFAPPGARVVTGDWNADGHTGFASRLGNVFTLVDEFGNAQGSAGYGKPSDEIYIGDWNANNQDTFAVRRGNIFYLRNTPTSGPADIVLGYGTIGDEVFVGDWNGNGQDTFAVRRGNVFYVRNSTTSGPADIVLGYGKAGDEVLVGDWNQDGIDTFAVRRGNIIFIRNDLQTGIAEQTIGYGKAGDTLLVGDYNNDGTDTFAVRRFEPSP